jgi:hypothetical protein
MFCKNDNGNLLVAVDSVLSADYQLFTDKHQDYQYPVDGWHWFVDEKVAREFFGLPENNFDQVSQQVYSSFLADN